MLEYGINCCPAGPSGIQDIIYQDNRVVFQVNRNQTIAGLRHIAKFRQIIPIQRNIHMSHRNFNSFELPDICLQHFRKRNTSALDA